MTLQTGQVLNNRYRIVKLLGEGGFGAVYRAWDTSFNMPCALKENTETSDQARRQFQREAQILHTLRHPNLPLVKDYFSLPDRGQYLVMDYIDGQDLLELMNERTEPFSEAQVLDWLKVICDAITYLHTQNPPVIHRDIKPANIKITPQGNAVLVDFGIFKIYDSNLPTTQGARAVTPGYSPFEQYGHAPTDERTDIYALGATTYTLLTGKTPVESIARMAGTELELPRAINPTISPNVEMVILQAMEVMPDNRFQSIAAFNKSLAEDNTPETSDVVSIRDGASGQAGTMAAMPSPKPLVVESQRGGAETPDTSTFDPASSPADKSGKSSRKSWVLPVMILTGIVLAAILIFIGLWTYNEGLFGAPHSEESVEEFVPPPEEDQKTLAGEWFGSVEMMEWDSPKEAIMLIEYNASTNMFHGELRIFHHGGEQDVREFEGEHNPMIGEIVFLDTVNWHYWGGFEGDMFGGELSLDCLFCDVHGAYEFHRK